MFPEDLIPLDVVKVNSHMKNKPVETAKMGLVTSSGTKKLSALTIATAIAALLTQHEIQYPQPTKNPIKSPKTILEYRYGPPFFPLSSLLKLLKIEASIIEPAAVNNQPKILMLPNFPRLAGSTYIPAPIMFPTTRDVVATNPIFSFC